MAADPTASSSSAAETPTENADDNSIQTTIDWRDPDGYTVRIAYNVAASPFISDPSNAPPGSTQITGDVATGSVTITNTTPGRNVDFSPGTALYRAYADDSTVCTTHDSWSPNYGVFDADGYCLVPAARLTYTLPDFAPDESRDVHLSDFSYPGPVNPEYYTVPESQALLDALARPAFSAIGGGTWEPVEISDGPLRVLKMCQYCGTVVQIPDTGSVN